MQCVSVFVYAGVHTHENAKGHSLSDWYSSTDTTRGPVKWGDKKFTALQ